MIVNNKMKKRVLATLVIGMVTATTACAISPAQRAKYERSGCTQVSVLQGCNLDKSYEWNQHHGFIKTEDAGDDYRGNDEHKHHGKHHDRDNATNDNHGDSGIDRQFYGNYEARFDGNSERAAQIHIEDSGVYVNGKEVRDTNAYKDTLTFRVGYATYTIKGNNHRGNWKDEDAGNAGTIVPKR